MRRVGWGRRGMTISTSEGQAIFSMVKVTRHMGLRRVRGTWSSRSTGSRSGQRPWCANLDHLRGLPAVASGPSIQPGATGRGAGWEGAAQVGSVPHKGRGTLGGGSLGGLCRVPVLAPPGLPPPCFPPQALTSRGYINRLPWPLASGMVSQRGSLDRKQRSGR